MKKVYLYISLALPLLGLLGLLACSGTQSSKTEDTVSANLTDTVITASDSVSGTLKDSTAQQTAQESGPKYIGTQAQLNHMHNSGSWEKYSTGILPQMAQDAPEYCGKILQKNSRFIIVDKAKMKLFLYDPYGHIEKSYPIACAKNYGARKMEWDSRTPEGLMDVEGVYNSSSWRFVSRSGAKSGPGVYGPKFIRIAPGIGIHGTSSPGSIGRRTSHGCIRLSNANILELVNYVDKGMPVIVSPGPKDMLVNQREGKNILAVVTENGTTRAIPSAESSLPADYGNSSKVASAQSNAKKAQAEKVVNDGVDSNPAVESPAETPSSPTEKVSEPSTSPASPSEKTSPASAPAESVPSE